jgi:hypothetical protein
MRNRAAAVFVLCLTSTASAFAQVPLGPEFRIDQGGAVSIHPIVNSHSIAVAPDGRFVVSWGAPGADGGPDVRARVFRAASGAAGPEFAVNAYTTRWQASDAVAMDDAGNFVICWSGNGPTTGYAYQVFAQRFDRSGARLGNEITINGTGMDIQPAVAMRGTGEFVVVWLRPSTSQLLGQRFDASGGFLGSEFQVNSTNTTAGGAPDVDVDAVGNFVVGWTSAYEAFVQRFAADGTRQGTEFRFPLFHGRLRLSRSAGGSFVTTWPGASPGGPTGILARRFDAAGTPVGSEFLVNGVTTGTQGFPDVDVAPDGGFVVTWTTPGAASATVVGRRFDAAGVPGPEFTVNSSFTNGHSNPNVSTDRDGNFVVTWRTPGNAPITFFNVMGRRFAAGLSAAALSVDATATTTANGNGVFEPGETPTVAPSWLNGNLTPQTFSGAATSFVGPGPSGNPAYTIADGAAAYGTVASGATASCVGDCYALGVTVPSTRPVTHWDATFHEDIAPANLGAAKTWTLHIGDSFTDVPRATGFYRFIETLLHNAVTGGCTSSTYCPSASATREQMAVFVLVAKERTGYAPPACTTPMFADVPATSPFCPWIEELARRGVVNGCGGGNYCPGSSVSREQMAIFTLLTRDPGVTPPACTTPMFNDVPASSPYCRWIEELARRGIVTGCGGGNYCPAASVTREQMAVFISATFGLVLYGP